jgi:hypothetical protein
MKLIVLAPLLLITLSLASCRAPEPEEYQDPYALHCVRERVRGPDGEMHEAFVLQRRLRPEEQAAYEAEQASHGEKKD